VVVEALAGGAALRSPPSVLAERLHRMNVAIRRWRGADTAVAVEETP
jgi:hypothetical protein